MRLAKRCQAARQRVPAPHPTVTVRLSAPLAFSSALRCCKVAAIVAGKRRYIHVPRGTIPSRESGGARHCRRKSGRDFQARNKPAANSASPAANVDARSPLTFICHPDPSDSMSELRCGPASAIDVGVNRDASPCRVLISTALCDVRKLAAVAEHVGAFKNAGFAGAIRTDEKLMPRRKPRRSSDSAYCEGWTAAGVRCACGYDLFRERVRGATA